MQNYSNHRIIDVKNTPVLKAKFILLLICYIFFLSNVSGEKIDNFNYNSLEETILIDDCSPVAMCVANLNIALGLDGNATLTPGAIDAGSFDPCGPITLSVSPNTFDCTDVGTTAVVFLTVTDEEGNTNQCWSNVTVSFPGQTMACVSQLNLSLGFDGTGSLEPEDILADPIFDPCDLFTVTPSFFTCDDVGQEFVVQVDDGSSGNFCWSTVLIEDKIPPTAVCNSTVSVSLDIDGNAFITPDMIDAGSYDNCSPLTYELSDSTFDCSNIGNNNVVYLTVTDVGGNTSLCFSVVNVEDNIELDILWPSDVLDIECGGNTDPATTGEPIIIDNCGTFATGYQDQIFNSGGNTIKIIRTWQVIEWLSGDVYTHLQLIKTIDTTPPTAVCVANINISLDQTGNAILSPEAIDAGSYDDCGDVTLTVAPSLFDCNDVGNTITVILTVTDENFNTNQCSSSVLVEDKMSPTAVCNAQVNVSLGADGTATISPTVIDAGSYDNCGPVTFSLSQSTFDCTDIGDSLVVLLTVTDASGNTNICWSQIVVEDKLAPTVTCPSDITVDCSDGDNLDPDITGYPTVVDNCDQTAYAYEDLIIPTCGTGFKVLRTWTIIDWYSGSVQECIQVIKVQDATPPELVCLTQLTASLDNSGSLTLYAEDLIISATDDCDSVYLSLLQNQFDCSDIGDTTVVVTAMDGCGNMSQCNVLVYIVDNTPPTAICQSQVNISLGIDGTATITTDVIDAGSFDACGPVTLSLSQSTFDCSDIGSGITVILTATDESGNMNECWSEVFVEDKIPPVATCPPDIIADCSLGDSPDPNITGFPSVVDNCDAIGYSYEDLVFPLGGANVKILRTWIVVDWYSLSFDTCYQVIKLFDTTPPNIACLNQLVASLDANGNLTLFPNDFDAGTSDDCGTFELSIDQSQFDCSDVGTTMVTVIATDDSGNASQCMVEIIISGLDADQDGYSLCEGDCNDNDGSISPGSPEICADGIDNNCDSQVDENCICPSYGQSTQFEWVESISVNGTANTTGDDGGYGDYTGIILEVVHGNNSVQLSPGFSGNKRKEYWSIWIDFNHNFVFDLNEEVFNDNSKNTINGSFNIPATALQGTTTMRIAMKYNLYSDPCEIFPEGEVEDYTVNISTPPYCQPGGQSTEFEWINKVQLKSINNTSGNNNGYADFTAQSTNLNPGQNKSIKLQPGYSGSSNIENWRVWVDWNEDGDFNDSGELEVQISSAGNVTGLISVPNNASGGNKIMRVSMKSGGYADPCELFSNGEVEDYTIFVTGSNPLVNEVTPPKAITMDKEKTELIDITNRDLDSKFEMKLYPNPVSNILNISINSPTHSERTIKVYNQLGQVWYDVKTDQNQHTIDISSDKFTSGMYMVVIQEGKEVLSQKMLVTK